MSKIMVMYCCGFNPRSHAGSDFNRYVNSDSFDVSIHAPTRGATRRDRRHHSRCRRFNPRSHAGSDPKSVAIFDMPAEFQSTLPRGERLPAYEPVVVLAVFQSTLPRGERLRVRKDQLPLDAGFNPRSHAGSDGRGFHYLPSAT